MQNKVSEKVQERVFALIFKRPENSECADCSAKGPRWVSLDYGIFICMNCAGAHRTLGPSVTRVRSTKLDGWIQEHIDIMEGIGNGVANSYYENQIQKSYNKPSTSASLETFTRFVNDKYVKKLFIPPNGVPDPKTAFLASKQSLKPFYFEENHNTNNTQQNTNDTQQSHDNKLVQGGQNLGDLLDMDQDEFQDFQQTTVDQPAVSNQTYTSNLSVRGSATPPNILSYTSMSPQKQDIFQPASSSQSLNFMSLYNQQQEQLPPNQQTQQAQNLNKYACLQNMGKQQQQQNHQQNHYQNYPIPQQQAWPQQHQNDVNKNQYQQQQPPQQNQSNQPVNILNLYGQQPQQQQNAYAGFRQTNSAQNYQ